MHKYNADNMYVKLSFTLYVVILKKCVKKLKKLLTNINADDILLKLSALIQCETQKNLDN